MTDPQVCTACVPCDHRDHLEVGTRTAHAPTIGGHGLPGIAVRASQIGHCGRHIVVHQRVRPVSCPHATRRRDLSQDQKTASEEGKTKTKTARNTLKGRGSLDAQARVPLVQAAPDATSCGGVSAASADTLQEAETCLRAALVLAVKQASLAFRLLTI